MDLEWKEHEKFRLFTFLNWEQRSPINLL